MATWANLVSHGPSHLYAIGPRTERTHANVVIGAGSIGIAIARRVSAGKHILLAALIQ